MGRGIRRGPQGMLGRRLLWLRSVLCAEVAREVGVEPLGLAIEPHEAHLRAESLVLVCNGVERRHGGGIPDAGVRQIDDNRLGIVGYSNSMITITAVSLWGIRLRIFQLMLCQSKVATETTSITATRAAMGMRPTRSPRPTARISSKMHGHHKTREHLAKKDALRAHDPPVKAELDGPKCEQAVADDTQPEVAGHNDGRTDGKNCLLVPGVGADQRAEAQPASFV